MKTLLFAFISLWIAPFLAAQIDEKGDWDAYLATFEDQKPGSVLLRMDLIDDAPVQAYGIVVVTGIKYESARTDGFPEDKTFSTLHELADGLVELITTDEKGYHVGSFTHDYERLEYFYVKSSLGLKEAIEAFYKKKYPEEAFYLNIKEDSNWEYYRDFLYPNDEILNYMGDLSVIRQLIDAGDNLEKSRRVDHWIYFRKKQDLESFIQEIKPEKFIVESIKVVEDLELPHSLQIWREDFVDIDSIYPISNELRLLAKKYQGEYDGWETFVVK